MNEGMNDDEEEDRSEPFEPWKGVQTSFQEEYKSLKDFKQRYDMI